MQNFNIGDIAKALAQVFSALPKSAQNSGKSAYKPVNGTDGGTTSQQKLSFGGDFSSKAQNKISPKQSVVEMLHRHDELSKKIDRQNENETEK